MEEDNKVEQEAPNTKFEQRPEKEADSSLFKQEDKSFADKFNEDFNSEVGPVTEAIREKMANRPALNYYKLLKIITAFGEATVKGTAELLGSAARGPLEFGKMVKENIEEGLETGKDGPSLTDVGKRLVGKDKEE